METWEAAARDFRYYLKSKGRSDETVRTYTSALSLFWRWCIQRETAASDVDRPAVRQWITERLDTVSNQRVHNDLAALRHYFTMLREDRFRRDDPTENITIKRGRREPTEPLWSDEFQRLLNSCTLDRDRVLLMIMGYTGMRISEVAGLTAEMIDWQRGEILITGKGDKQRRITVNTEALGWLHSFLGMFPEGPIWRSHARRSVGQPLTAHQLRKVIYRIGERAGVEVHPHRLRAMMATQYVEQFQDIQALQGVLGHSSIETTARYSQWTRERRGQEQMRRLKLA